MDPARVSFYLNSVLRNKDLSKDFKFVTVYVASGQPEAQMLKGFLENEGIPAILRYESLGLVYGLTIDGLGQVELQVPSSLAQQAKDILGFEENSNSKPSDQAPSKET